MLLESIVYRLIDISGSWQFSPDRNVSPHLGQGAFKRKEKVMKYEVPIWEKSNLTLEEAAAYSNIGICKLREMTNDNSCKFVLWVGNRRLIKRKKLDEYIDKAYSI